MRQYIALIHKEATSDYGVSFPDLPGCVTAGVDLDDARTMAEEALSFHLEGMAEDGDAAPEPSSLEAIMADRENRDAVAILVPVKVTPPKIVRLNITMAENVLAEVDAFAEAQGMNRSGFLAAAALEAMRRIADAKSKGNLNRNRPIAEQLVLGNSPPSRKRESEPDAARRRKTIKRPSVRT